jgi:hypothetical protein
VRDPHHHKRPRRHGVLAAKICGLTAASLVVAAALAVGSLIWRLSSGPMQITQIARAAETALAHSLGPGATAKVGEAQLDWSWDNYGFIVRLSKVEATSRTGGFQMAVDSADIALRTVPILWGSVKPTALDLDSPSIKVDLTRFDPAAMAQGAEPAAAPAVAPQQIDDKDSRPAVIRVVEHAIRGMADALDNTHAEGFTSISVEHGVVDIARMGAQRNIIHVNVPDIEIDGEFNTAGDLDLSFSAKGEVGRWGMRLRQTRQEDGSRQLLFEGNDATARDLIGELPPDVILDIPVYPTIAARLDPRGTLDTLRVDLRLGAGQFHFGKYPDDEMLIDEGDIAAHWDGATNSFIVDQAGASTGPTTLSVKGRLTPPARGSADEIAHKWTFDLGLDKGILNPRDAGTEALQVDSIHLGGSLDLSKRWLAIDDIDLRFGDARLSGNGSIDFTPEKPQMVFSLNLPQADWQTIRRAWPIFIATGARNWFVKNVTGGTVTDAVIKLDLPMFTEPKDLPSTAIAFSGKVRNGSFHTFGNVPDAVQVEGRFSSANRQFEAVAVSAKAATKYPKRPDVVAMRLLIADSYKRNPRGHIEFHMIGENGAIGEIANAEPLAVLDNAGVKLDGLQGSTDVQGTVDLTLDDNPKPDQIDYRIQATIDRFGSPYAIQGRKFQDASLSVIDDPKGTTISGKAKIDGVVTDVKMFEPRNAAKGSERRDFKMTLDEATRVRMGLDLGPVLTGPVQVAITQPPGGNERARHIEADLTQARLTLAPFGWTKGAGVPAKASVDMFDDDKGTRLENFTLDSEGVQVKGRADFDVQHKPVLIEISRFQLRKGDDAKAKIQRQPDQTIVATFEAAAFDMRGLIQAMKHSGDAGEGDKSKWPDVQIKARLAKVTGFNDIAVSDLVIDAALQKGNVNKLTLSGQLPGGRSLGVQIKPQSRTRDLSITSDDAGSVLGFFDIYDRMRGGGFDLRSTLSSANASEGSLRILGFRLEPQGRDRQLNIEADGVRSAPIRQVAPTDQTTFDKFAASYSVRKGVITMTQGIAKGPTTGATASGQIDLNNQRIQITGTFIPLYGLNNLVSRIPLLGEIAGAGRNEGLVGVTFKVVGSVDDPVLQVNPISAIAPGIFRRIFEYHVDGPRAGDETERSPSGN